MYVVFLRGTAVDLDSNFERDSNILAVKTSTVRVLLLKIMYWESGVLYFSV